VKAPLLEVPGGSRAPLTPPRDITPGAQPVYPYAPAWGCSVEIIGSC
jgi:hypothetical protein